MTRTTLGYCVCLMTIVGPALSSPLQVVTVPQVVPKANKRAPAGKTPPPDKPVKPAAAQPKPRPQANAPGSAAACERASGTPSKRQGVPSRAGGAIVAQQDAGWSDTQSRCSARHRHENSGRSERDPNNGSRPGNSNRGGASARTRARTRSSHVQPAVPGWWIGSAVSTFRCRKQHGCVGEHSISVGWLQASSAAHRLHRENHQPRRQRRNADWGQDVLCRPSGRQSGRGRTEGCQLQLGPLRRTPQPHHGGPVHLQR